jgi:hypothetical protein
MTYNLACRTERRGRDQHLEAGSPGDPILMEPTKDRRRHGGLRAPRRATSRCSGQS